MTEKAEVGEIYVWRPACQSAHLSKGQACEIVRSMFLLSQLPGRSGCLRLGMS